MSLDGSDPVDLTRPLPVTRADKSVKYAITQPRTPETGRKRHVRPRQDVIGTVIGKLEPGGKYLLGYDQEQVNGFAVDSLLRRLRKFGEAWTPHIHFFAVPRALFTWHDLTPYSSANTPSLLERMPEEARIQSAMTPSNKRYKL